MIEFSASCPEECPSAPIMDAEGTTVPCSMILVRTSSEKIRIVYQCSRCGYLDPATLDRWAESAVKESLTASQARTALAIDGEPFTFVRSSEEDVRLDEALAQALGAASMCWSNIEAAGVFNSSRAKRIFQQLYAFVREHGAA